MTATAPQSTAPSGWRPIHVWGVALAAAGVVYGVSLTPGISWGDSGEAQLHTLLGGWYVEGEIVRSHVLYYALARFLAFVLPIDAVRAANITAALGGAVTVANVAWLMATFCRTRVAIVCGAALILFSHTLWQLSSAAEVITLSTALLSTELICFVRLSATRRLGWLAALLFANGLGVSNHNFALLMWPVYVLVGLRFWNKWSVHRVRMVLVGLGSLVLGMIPVLLLCVDDLLARGSFTGTLESFFVGQYGHKVSNFGRIPGLLGRSVLIAVLNFPTPLLLFAITGPFVFRRRMRRSVFWFVGVAALAYLAFGARYNVRDQHVFLVPAFVFVAIFIAVGLDEFLLARHKRWAMSVACLLAVLGPVVYVAAPQILRSRAPDLVPLPTREILYRDEFNWHLRPWRTGDDGAERFARATFALLPEGAWLFVDSTLLPPLNTLQVVEGLRRDVRMDNRHARQDWLEPIREDDDAMREAALRAGRAYSSTDRFTNLLAWLRDRQRRLGGIRYEPVEHIYHVLPGEERQPRANAVRESQ